MTSCLHHQDAAVPTDLYSTAVFLRDQLKKVEDRCISGQERGEQLKQHHAALLEAIKWFKLVEQNEKNVTDELRRELTLVEEEQARGIWPASPAPIPSRRPSTTDSSSSPLVEGPKTSLIEQLGLRLNFDSGSANDHVSENLFLPINNHPFSPTSPFRRTIQDSWKRRFSELLPASRDVSSASPNSDTSQLVTTPRKFGGLADSRMNTTILAPNGYSHPIKPKYVGGIALKKSMPHRSHRKWNKSCMPLLLSKARLTRKRSTALRISAPMLATPILCEGKDFKQPFPDESFESSDCLMQSSSVAVSCKH
ncbi:unnamed protein product [Somion occarium]|uniref:Uncharacterized protein n=1 Tax=Somion occarium TaxID=3059160 RepID=A0ABP1CRX3_9APHY